MNDAQVTRQIVELLRQRHVAPEWASFVELAVSTGFARRYLDFYAMNCWKSKRFLKVAYEVKASRADFAKELTQPLKRKDAEELADECYFACPVGMVQPDEVPEGWGLIEMTSGGLRVKKRAMQREVEVLPLEFVMSIARRSSDPEPELPKAVWLYAGQELTEEMLLEVATEHLDAHDQEVKIAAVGEYRRSDEVKRLRDLADVVMRYLGWGYSDPEKLRQWFSSFSEDGRMAFDPRAYQVVLEVQRQVNQLAALFPGRSGE